MSRDRFGSLKLLLFFLTSIKIIQYDYIQYDDIFNLLDTLLFKHPQRMPESIYVSLSTLFAFNFDQLIVSRPHTYGGGP